MSALVVITIRMLPPREVSPNGGWSWRQRHEARREYRSQAAWATKLGVLSEDRWIRDAPRVLLDAEIEWCCGRKRMDDDNAKACLKSAIDGIADVLWEGDDSRVIVGAVTQSRGNGVTRITLREASGDE